MILWIALGLVMLGGPYGAWAAPFSNVIVFGDSLSDTGNAFAGTGGTIPIVPPYFPGRFSNGPNYVEGLAAGLGLQATAVAFGGTNFAVGGARIGRFTPPLLAAPSLLDQGTLFLSHVPSADPTALYVVFGGANDVRDVAFGFAPLTTIPTAVNDLATLITTLAQAGATNFLVPNLPNLGTTPESHAVDLLSPGFAANATTLSRAFDTLLASRLASLEATLGLTIHSLDVFALLDSAVANPVAFGLSNVTEACIGQGNIGADITVGDSTPCVDPDQYLFWDAIHPTAHGHAILATAALHTVVPEPATAVFMSLGVLGLLGYSWFRRFAV